MQITFTINEKTMTIDVKPSLLLIDLIRDVLKLKGTKPGCLEGECHYIEGNLKARRKVEYVKKTLTELGIEPERVEMYNLSSAQGARFAEIASEMVEKIKELGPTPIKNNHAA